MKFRSVPIAVLVLTLIDSVSGLACPTCYGAQDSPMTAGMNTAILVMLGIIGGVLASFVSFFLYLWRRNKNRTSNISHEAYVTKDGVLKTKHEKGVMEWNNF